MSDLRFLGHDLIFVSTKPAAAQDAEIAADRERAEGLGLSFSQTAAPPQKEATDG